MSTYSLDSEVAAFVARSQSFYSGSAGSGSVAESRAVYDRMCRAFEHPYPDSLTAKDGVLRAGAPDREIPWRRYLPRGAVAGRTILYFHGGGFVVGGLASHDSICADLAAGAGAALVALDYRLAPEHRYPAALDDAEAAYDMLLRAGETIVVAGDSAGGNLAAALCLRLRRLGRPMPAAQVLIYPGLHPKAGRAAGTWREAVPMLTAADSIAYRRLYTGRHDVGATEDAELAPLAAGNFSGLPQAAIFAANIDPLAEDAADYAGALRSAGVAASLQTGDGLVHGYLRGRRESARIAEAFAAICAASRDFTHRA